MIVIVPWYFIDCSNIPSQTMCDALQLAVDDYTTRFVPHCVRCVYVVWQTGRSCAVVQIINTGEVRSCSTLGRIDVSTRFGEEKKIIQRKGIRRSIAFEWIFE